ncbi:MAG: hypothetical protein G01um101444_390 [Parcubacteria group bacterium Gr01-1014_44]|nr:MAG: hypothetical protein G01um101444_390 [Parcubacteria group bacterium Gr01-1014_44]
MAVYRKILFIIKKNSGGFTLVEVLMYAILAGFFSVFLLLNLGGSQTNSAVLERASLAVISDFRRAQNLSIFGSTFQGGQVCGYGLHYLTPDSYLIYAGGEAVCSTANRNYQGGSDFTVQTVKIVESHIQFKSPFDDVFFEPPDPKIFINNFFSSSAAPLAISIGFKNQGCPAGCKTITIFPSGKIDFN